MIFRNFSTKWFDIAKKKRLTIIPGQHGARILDKTTFNQSGGFDEQMVCKSYC